MPRANIRGKDKDVLTDDGAVLFSIAQGEQIHIPFTFDWISDFTGYTITAKVVEGNNVAGDADVAPSDEEATPVITTLTIIDDTVADNTFKVVLPDDLADTWAVGPTPDDPAYGFFSLQIADTGSGDAQQIFVPVRGMVEVRYNAVEAT